MKGRFKIDIKKGQKVWIKTYGFGVIETEVITVGRKYITVKQWKLKFDKDSFRSVGGCGSPSILILDLDEYKRKSEIETLKYKLQKYNWDKIDLERLERVYEIMKDII